MNSRPDNTPQYSTRCPDRRAICGHCENSRSLPISRSILQNERGSPTESEQLHSKRFQLPHPACSVMVHSLSLIREASKVKVMVASTVYNFEDQLDQICAILGGYGYTVWNSHLGTIPTDPQLSNLENCIAAARSCDLFLGIIRPFYGTGQVCGTSITHEEFRAALAIGKPRWFLVHRNVTLARQLLKPYLYKGDGNRTEFSFKKTAVLDDVRVFDMYDDATQATIPLEERTGNWVQEFGHVKEIQVFLEAQFKDIKRIRAICERKGTP